MEVWICGTLGGSGHENEGSRGRPAGRLESRSMQHGTLRLWGLWDMEGLGVCVFNRGHFGVHSVKDWKRGRRAGGAREQGMLMMQIT